MIRQNRQLHKQCDINRIYLRNIKGTKMCRAKQIIISGSRLSNEFDVVKNPKQQEIHLEVVDPYITSVHEDGLSTHRNPQVMTQSQGVGVDAQCVELNQTSFQRVSPQDIAGALGQEDRSRLNLKLDPEIIENGHAAYQLISPKSAAQKRQQIARRGSAPYPMVGPPGRSASAVNDVSPSYLPGSHSEEFSSPRAGTMRMTFDSEIKPPSTVVPPSLMKTRYINNPPALPSDIFAMPKKQSSDSPIQISNFNQIKNQQLRFQKLKETQLLHIDNLIGSFLTSLKSPKMRAHQRRSLNQELEYILGTRERLKRQFRNSVCCKGSNAPLTRRKFLGGNQVSSHFDFNNIHQMYTRNRDKRGEGSLPAPGAPEKIPEGVAFRNKRIALKAKTEALRKQ